MMKTTPIVLAMALLLMMVPLVRAAAITPVWEYTSVDTSNAGATPYTLGFEFSTSTTFQINALGFWNVGGNHQVAIWDTSGNQLVSTTVLSTDPVTGHFAYDPVSYTLAPGTYVIGGFLPGGLFPIDATGVTSLPGYTWLSAEFFFNGFGFPNTSEGSNVGQNGYGIVDFSVATVPEPGTLLLLGTGLVGVVSTLRRRTRR